MLTLLLVQLDSSYGYIYALTLNIVSYFDITTDQEAVSVKSTGRFSREN